MESRLYVNKKDYDRIIKFFNSNHNNSETNISKRLKIDRHIVQHSLDYYLSKKRNYIGAEPMYEIVHKPISDKYDTIINGSRYSSLKTAANALGIESDYLKELIPKGECSVNVKIEKETKKYNVKTRTYKIKRELKNLK